MQLVTISSQEYKDDRSPTLAVMFLWKELILGNLLREDPGVTTGPQHWSSNDNSLIRV